MKAFHKKFYGASYGEFVVVGEFEPETTQKEVSDLFNSWKTPVKHVRIATPYSKVAPESKVIEAPDKANAMFAAAMPVKMKDSDADYAALVLGNYILGSRMEVYETFRRLHPILKEHAFLNPKEDEDDPYESAGRIRGDRPGPGPQPAAEAQPWVESAIASCCCRNRPPDSIMITYVITLYIEISRSALGSMLAQDETDLTSTITVVY